MALLLLLLAAAAVVVLVEGSRWPLAASADAHSTCTIWEGGKMKREKGVRVRRICTAVHEGAMSWV